MAKKTNSSSTATEILIVEDSAIEAELLRRSLARAGYRVTIAKDGEEGLQAARARRPDLILSDINMPVMNGYELCRAIKLDKALWNVPVILLTVLTEPEDILEALNSGADGYITKPFIEPILLERIGALLDTAILRKRAEERRSEQVEYNGKLHTIIGGSQQILNLLFSVYENNLSQNRDLTRIQLQLTLLNESLEDQVAERTRSLQESEEKYRTIFEEAKDGIALIDESGMVVNANPEFMRQTGRTLEQLKQTRIWELSPADKVELAERRLQEFWAAGGGQEDKLGFERPSGEIVQIEFRTTTINIGGERYLQSVSSDITERAEREKKINSLNRALRILSDCNNILIHATTEEELLRKVCDKFIEAGGYLLAWVSYPGAETDSIPVPFVYAGDEALYRLHAGLDLDPEHQQQCLTSIALRESKTMFCNSLKEAPECSFGPLYDAGVAAILAMPLLLANHEVYGVFTLFSSSHDAFGADEIRLAEELAADLAFGIVTLRTRVERERAEVGRKLFRELLDHSSDAIEVTDPETLRFVDVNETACRQLGYSRDELLSMRLQDIDSHMGEQQIRKIGEGLQANGATIFESRHRRKDGSTIPVEVSATSVRLDREYGVSVVRDITERKAAQAQLQLSAQLLDSTADSIIAFDLEGNLIFINEATCRARGYTHDEMMAMNLRDIDTPEAAKFINSHINELQQKGSSTFESVHRCKDGTSFPVEVSARFVELGELKMILASMRDITERKRNEEVLRESEEKFRAIFDHASDGIIVMDVDERSVRFANRSMEQMLGYGPGELTGLAMARLHPPEALAQAGEQFDRDTRSNRSMVQDMPMLTKDGGVLYADLSGSPVDIGGQHYQLGAFRDATARRAVEMKLRRANRALQTLSAGNLALVQAADEDELPRSITAVIAEQAGYNLAVVDYAEDDPERSLMPMAWSGFEGSHYWAEHLSWADTEWGQLPVSRAIRSGTTQVCHDISADPAFNPWREVVQAHGYQANIALPLRDNDKIFGGLSIYSSDENAFDKEEIPLLEELANDLAYGIVTLRTRKQHEQHTIILRQSLEQSIQTIADTVEARDAYTAGHQRRVAELATAIARGMGLPEDQINGIHLAGIVHDLGKIHVPAEILSKPGKLSRIEYELIKTHPQDGYDILKNVKFPWPIADIIRQHHERLDGSGYPQGLKGDAILLEARIMAVADVVEAMSSHRPYRASLGIEPALDEIRRGRGSEYDPVVVDACLKLFSENKFAFSDHA